MATPHLHVLGIDPGGTTGWALLTVPRASIFGSQPASFLTIDYGEFFGPEDEQAIAIARLAREVQSLDYKIGPALVVEDFDLLPHYSSTNAETVLSPVRIAAKIALLHHLGQTGDSKLIMQGRTIAKSTATDDRLRAWGLYIAREGDHIRDGMRHAITALRRAKDSAEFRSRMWAS